MARSAALLQVVTSTDRRGAEVFAVDLGAALAVRGWQPRTVALAPGVSGGLDIPCLGSGKLAPSALRALRGEARRSRAVVAHGSTTLLACALASALAGPPFVYRSIGDPRYWSSAGPRRHRTTPLLRRARRVVVLWAAAADALMRLHGVPAARIHVIPNGVPAAAFPLVDAAARRAARQELDLPAEAPIALYLGALSAEKDVGLAIRALAALDSVHLVVAGDGPERPALQRLAAELLGDRASFLRSVERPQRALAAADVLVLPSRTEGIPAVLIEAGLSGVPVVATDVGGVREVITSGETGLVVPVGDATALQRAVGEVLAAPAAFTTAARQRCLERFEIGPVADAWDELLDDVVASG